MDPPQVYQYIIKESGEWYTVEPLYNEVGYNKILL